MSIATTESPNPENIAFFRKQIEEHKIQSCIFVVWQSVTTRIKWAGIDGHGADGRRYSVSWQTDTPPTLNELRAALPVPVVQKTIDEICPP